MPQVNQRTENRDKSNKGIKILLFKMSFVEKKKKADVCIYKLNGKGEYKVIIHCSHYTRPWGQLHWMIRQRKINTFSYTNICHRYLGAIYKRTQKAVKQIWELLHKMSQMQLLSQKFLEFKREGSLSTCPALFT